MLYLAMTIATIFALVMLGYCWMEKDSFGTGVFLGLCALVFITFGLGCYWMTWFISSVISFLFAAFMKGYDSFVLERVCLVYAGLELVMVIWCVFF